MINVLYQIPFWTLNLDITRFLVLQTSVWARLHSRAWEEFWEVSIQPAVLGLWHLRDLRTVSDSVRDSQSWWAGCVFQLSCCSSWITCCHIVNWSAFLKHESTPSESVSFFIIMNGILSLRQGRGKPKEERKIPWGDSTEGLLHCADFLEQWPWLTSLIKSNNTSTKC